MYAPSCTFLAADAPLEASSRADISRHVMGKVFDGLSIAADEVFSRCCSLRLLDRSWKSAPPDSRDQGIYSPVQERDFCCWFPQL